MKSMVKRGLLALLALALVLAAVACTPDDGPSDQPEEPGESQSSLPADVDTPPMGDGDGDVPQDDDGDGNPVTDDAPPSNGGPVLVEPEPQDDAIAYEPQLEEPLDVETGHTPDLSAPPVG